MSHTSVDFEQAISLTGYGRFHYSLFACCSLCVLSVSFQNGIGAYIIPAARCDLKLTFEEMGFLNVSFLIGGISSCFLWGLIGDVVGRKNVLLYTLLTDWFFNFCSSFSQTFLTLTIFRFLSGFFIGASGTLVFSYLAEFQNAKNRAKVICYIGLFFAAAWVLLPAVAWLIIPIQWEYRTSYGFVFNSWRLYILAFSFSSLFSGIWFATLPESPKFLYARGDTNGALTVLKYIYSKNTGKSPEEYQVKILVDEHLSEKINSADQVHGTVGMGRTARLIKEINNQLKLLFRPPLCFLTILTSFILFSNMFGYYGLGLWIPEIFSRFEEFRLVYPDQSKTFCQIQRFCADNECNHTLTAAKNVYNGTQQEVPPEEICDSTMDNAVFINTIIMGACCLLGNICSGYLAGRLDRRVVPVVTMVAGGACALSIYWLNSGTQLIVSASVFQTTMAISNMALNAVIVDLYPTSVSGMAICTATLAGRLGAIFSNLTFGFFLDSSCETPIFVCTVVVIAGGLLGVIIPGGKKGEQKCKTEKKDKTITCEVAVISK